MNFILLPILPLIRSLSSSLRFSTTLNPFIILNCSCSHFLLLSFPSNFFKILLAPFFSLLILLLFSVPYSLSLPSVSGSVSFSLISLTLSLEFSRSLLLITFNFFPNLNSLHSKFLFQFAPSSSLSACLSLSDSLSFQFSRIL